MYVSRWTGRAYFLSEKPIACAQNEVLNRMLSSSGEVRAAWGDGCCSSARGCAECLAQSRTMWLWLVWGPEHLQELPTVSVMVWWGGDSSPSTGNRLQAMKQPLTSINFGLTSWESCWKLLSLLRPKKCAFLFSSVLSELTALSLLIFLPNFSVSF